MRTSPFWTSQPDRGRDGGGGEVGAHDGDAETERFSADGLQEGGGAELDYIVCGKALAAHIRGVGTGREFGVYAGVVSLRISRSIQGEAGMEFPFML